MIIMVAVTVTIIAGENGVLEQTKESAELTEQAQLHEQIMGAMKLTNKGKIIVGDSYEAAKALLESQGYDVGDFNEADGTFEVTGKKGIYKYKITETEITIEETKGEETKPITPTDQKYLLFNHNETNGESTFKGMNPDYLMDNGYYGEDNYIITDLVIPSVVLNESGEESLVTEIGTNVGPNGNNLTIKTVVLPDSVKSIGAYSFNNWTALTTINIPSKVTSFNAPIFSNCTSLISITLPEGFTSLMGPVFQNCTSLTSINIPSSVEIIIPGVFSGCSSDLKIYVDKYESECSSWPSAWKGNATVIYKIKQEADESRPVDSKYLRLADIGDGTAMITGFNQEYKLPDGNYGEGNYIITDLIIPSKGIVNGIEQLIVGIAPSSFRACSTIKTLVIPETLETILPYAFYDCTNLIKVEIPSSVTTIGANTFGGCSSDLKIYIDKYESECSDWPSDWFGTGTVIYKK